MYFKKSIYLLIFLLSQIQFIAQDDTTKLAFVSYWSIGDSYTYKITKTGKRWRGEELIKNEVESYFSKFIVIDSTASSYTIKWSFIKDSLSNKEKDSDLSIYKYNDVIYKTSDVGAFLEIVNWEEISNNMITMVNKVIEDLDKDDNRKFRKSMNAMLTIFSSKQSIEQIAFKELQCFHFPLGVEYDLSKPILYEDELPNMLGGKPIKANGKVYFEGVEFDENFCVMIQEMEIDSEDMKRVLMEFFKKMNLTDKEIKKSLKTSTMNIRDYNRYEYFYYPGIPHKINCTRNVNFNMSGKENKKIDVVEIELMY